MKILRTILDSQARHFQKGGKLEAAYPFYEALDTFLYTPGQVTKGGSHVRDGLDLKRMMVTVVIALIPAVFMAMYNTGLQTHRAISQGALPQDTWQTAVMIQLGQGGFDPGDLVGLHAARRALLPSRAAGHLPDRGPLRSPFRRRSQARNQRGIPGDGNALPLDPATNHSLVAGGPGHCLRGHRRQGDLRGDGNEHPEPGADGQGLPLLCLSRRDLGEQGLGGGPKPAPMASAGPPGWPRRPPLDTRCSWKD